MLRGPKTAKIILELVEGPEWFFTANLSDIKHVTALSDRVLLKMNRTKALLEAARISKKHEQLGVSHLFINDQSCKYSLP